MTLSTRPLHHKPNSCLQKALNFSHDRNTLGWTHAAASSLTHHQAILGLAKLGNAVSINRSIAVFNPIFLKEEKQDWKYFSDLRPRFKLAMTWNQIQKLWKVNFNLSFWELLSTKIQTISAMTTNLSNDKEYQQRHLAAKPTTNNKYSPKSHS